MNRTFLTRFLKAKEENKDSDEYLAIEKNPFWWKPLILGSW